MNAVSKKGSARHIEALLIEDNPGDVRLTEEVLRQTGVACNLSTMRDPEHALAYLRGEPAHAEKARPDLIFLDLNLPKFSGLEIIEEIRRTKGLEYLPIVVFSSTCNPAEIRRVYQLGGNCFVRKPIELDEFIRALTTCYEFWCGIVELPPREPKP